ncbi:MAG: hypothetical protein ACR2GY_05730 [Phycisphaerales bacterium]
MMRTIAAICYWCGLLMWLSALFASGVSAIFVFATLPELGVHLDRYAAYAPAENAAHAHSVLAGGHIMERIFTVSDFVQITAAALIVTGMLLKAPRFDRIRRPLADGVRMVLIGIACVLLIVHVGWRAPEFNRTLRDYWTHAAAGEMQLAAVADARLETLHHGLRMNLQINAGLLMMVLLLSAAVTARRPDHGEGDD